ncbi:hypothetical protein EPIB2_164 [Tritonibacter mobilis]|nr:hypothetical protein EPIB2_164 [Tritonibacter mobilis]
MHDMFLSWLIRRMRKNAEAAHCVKNQKRTIRRRGIGPD